MDTDKIAADLADGKRYAIAYLKARREERNEDAISIINGMNHGGDLSQFIRLRELKTWFYCAMLDYARQFSQDFPVEFFDKELGRINSQEASGKIRELVSRDES